MFRNAYRQATAALSVYSLHPTVNDYSTRASAWYRPWDRRRPPSSEISHARPPSSLQPGLNGPLGRLWTKAITRFGTDPDGSTSGSASGMGQPEPQGHIRWDSLDYSYETPPPRLPSREYSLTYTDFHQPWAATMLGKRSSSQNDLPVTSGSSLSVDEPPIYHTEISLPHAPKPQYRGVAHINALHIPESDLRKYGSLYGSISSILSSGYQKAEAWYRNASRDRVSGRTQNPPPVPPKLPLSDNTTSHAEWQAPQIQGYYTDHQITRHPSISTYRSSLYSLGSNLSEVSDLGGEYDRSPITVSLEYITPKPSDSNVASPFDISYSISGTDLDNAPFIVDTSSPTGTEVPNMEHLRNWDPEQGRWVAGWQSGAASTVNDSWQDYKHLIY